ANIIGHPTPGTARPLEQVRPLVRRLPDKWTPEYCFRRLCSLPGCVWLDSSLNSEALGRYSYLAADPFSTLRIDKPSPLVCHELAQLSERYAQPKLDGLPPMQGGWMGWLGYELGTCF